MNLTVETKKMNDMSAAISFVDMPAQAVDFATYCIGNLARTLGLDEKTIYLKLRDSDILNGYIIAAYDVLHTFGKKYLMEDIIGLMKKRGVA